MIHSINLFHSDAFKSGKACVLPVAGIKMQIELSNEIEKKAITQN